MLWGQYVFLEIVLCFHHGVEEVGDGIGKVDDPLCTTDDLTKFNGSFSLVWWDDGCRTQRGC